MSPLLGEWSDGISVSLFLSRVIGAYLVELPVPDIINQTPDHILVSIDGFLLGPEIPAGETWELLEVVENFLIVRLYSCHVLWVSIQSFDDWTPASESVKEVTKEDSIATVPREIC